MLCIRDLRVAYGETLALDGLSFEVRRGEVFALVGESGCGKTTAALALMRYLPRGGRVVSGGIESMALTCSSWMMKRCGACAAPRWRWCIRIQRQP
jgi:ABC-type glutathione transport system ATPase component